MTLASHQPNFFPYMGYFYKIAKSDIFIFSDDVKFSNTKNGDMHNYNYIKGPHGKQKITLPVSYKSGALVKEVIVSYDDKKQIRSIVKTIEQYYGKTPYFSLVYPDIKMIFDVSFCGLADYNIYSIWLLCERFGITTKFIRSPGFASKKCSRIIEMCRHFEADTYLCGSGAAAYINEDEFISAGINLVLSDYKPPIYPQRYGEFIPNLSVLDWIFNKGYILPEGWLPWKK